MVAVPVRASLMLPDRRLNLTGGRRPFPRKREAPLILRGSRWPRVPSHGGLRGRSCRRRPRPLTGRGPAFSAAMRHGRHDSRARWPETARADAGNRGPGPSRTRASARGSSRSKTTGSSFHPVPARDRGPTGRAAGPVLLARSRDPPTERGSCWTNTSFPPARNGTARR
jgi:hypothetical protein